MLLLKLIQIVRNRFFFFKKHIKNSRIQKLIFIKHAYDMIKCSLTPLIGNLVGQERKIEGLLEILKVMHLIERYDDLIMADFINYTFSLIIGLLSRLVYSNNISRTELSHLGSLLLLVLRLLCLLLPVKMEQNSAVDTCADLFDH